jgi:hypothetical protein
VGARVPLSFTEIFRNEIEVINFRRRAVQAGAIAAARRSVDQPEPAPATAASEAEGQRRRHFVIARTEVAVEQNDAEAERRGTSRTTQGNNLTGIALSGGGVRSASFCLGVLQALDSLSTPDEPHVLDAVDYLSTVSGGGYIGTSLVAGLMQPDYSFPFDSRLDEQEPPETQHLRDFSNFLAPNGMIDYLTSAAFVLRGLLVNAVIVLPALLIFAVITVASNPLVADLVVPDVFGISIATGPIRPIVVKGLEPFTLTLNLAILAALLMFGSAIFTSLTFRKSTLRAREMVGRFLGALLVVVCTAALFEFQPFVLAGMLSASKSVAAADLPAGPIHDALSTFASILPSLAAVLMPVAAALITIAQKLANLAKASLGEATWTAALKKHGSRAALYLAAVIVPLLLWITYIYLSFWAIRTHIENGCGPSTPAWLQSLSACHATGVLPAIQRLGPIGTTYLAIALLLSALCLLIGPNSNSLHRLYRDRLSRAFLFERLQMGSRTAASNVDRWTFSSLKPFNEETKGWLEAAAFSPYLLTNTAINLEGSRELNKRGRNADTFIFSPLHVGSRSTGYVRTKEMEELVPELGLATAMATSGAAASANMGSSTIKVLTFSLSLLNVRLGYWLANPARLDAFRRRFNRWRANVGTWYFAAETAGQLNEKRLNVYLTDGGHIENLGVYELLRRRCKVIVAVDAEADPNMTFPSFVNLEVLARIDLGVRMDLPWQALQKSALGVTGDTLYGPNGPPGSRGPHAAIGIIRYSNDETGVLIYLKSSLSGDENDYVLDYKRRNPTFPHETTVDQFFNEEQFEAYRALGFHVARGLFTGADDFAKHSSPPPSWRAEVSAALALLNVPETMAAAAVARI